MEAITVVFLVGLTFLTRFLYLLKIPIFTDEAIYIRWAQIGLADPNHRYISLTDGKQPLFTWLMYPFLKIFPDPLLAGRLVSVCSGLFGILGLYFLARELFGRKTAFFSGLLYVISPFALTYDRLALMDSLLSSFGLWSLFLEVLLVRYLRLDIALILGMVVGLGLLTKSSAQFHLYFLPFSLLLFDWKKRNRIQRFFKWLGLALISVFLAQVIYNSLRLSPWFYLIEIKNHSFILTWEEFFQSPFRLFLPNLHGLSEILVGYLTWPIFMIAVLGTLFGFFRKDSRLIFLFLCFVFPFLSLAFFGKVIFPRFILFMVMPLLVIVAFFLSSFFTFSVSKLKIFLLIIPLIFFPSLYQSFLLIFFPVKADIPIIDRNQLFDDWPSGYGIREVVNFLQEKTKEGKVVVGTEGTFGLFPAALEIYLGTNKNVEIYGFWPVSEVPPLLLEKAKKFPTYLLFKEKQEIPSNWPLKKEAWYPRGKGKTYLKFYQVIPLEDI